jgi:diguanylate cyclase (GGDEF)-like protein
MNMDESIALPTAEAPPTGRVLVVDDQRLNVQALYQAFCADHKVYMATSGEQALAVCTAQLPDIVLLDVVMPGMDGYEVCRRLKEQEATRDIPVIFITAHDDEAAETHGLALGAVDFISKPINPAIVRARVKTHLTLKRQSDLLRRWVYVDGLTVVCNRRGFDERLAVEWGRAVRLGAPLSVVMVDVDLFKRYNDHYGHQAGDDCLRRVASALRSALKRPADLVARYGGEEFVCLLPDTDAAGAFDCAQSLRTHVLQAQIDHAASTVAPLVTVSLGAATGPSSDGTGALSLLHRADAALYAAKSQGRNRVCSEAARG